MKYILLLLSFSSLHAADDGFEAASSTKFDFSEATIDGKFKAPAGFFLTGLNPQDKTNMVTLRPNFRSELKQSSSVVKSAVK